MLRNMSNYVMKPFNIDKILFQKKYVHMTPYELKGLQHLVESLGSLPKSKKFIPFGIENPFGLLTAAKQLIFDHDNDDPELAVTGEAIASWPKPTQNLKRWAKYNTGSGSPWMILTSGLF